MELGKKEKERCHKKEEKEDVRRKGRSGRCDYERKKWKIELGKEEKGIS